MQPLEHAAAIGDVLEALSIPWVLGGSLASSLYGEPRSTNDVDIALRLDPDGVPALIAAVGDRYYLPVQALVDAARRHHSASLLELATGFKIDLFFLGDGPLDRWQLARRQLVDVTGISRPLWVTSPADLVLRKLWWFQLGGEVSDRQWRDITTILRVQLQQLNTASLAADASEVGLHALLQRALEEATA